MKIIIIVLHVSMDFKYCAWLFKILFLFVLLLSYFLVYKLVESYVIRDKDNLIPIQYKRSS